MGLHTLDIADTTPSIEVFLRDSSSGQGKTAVLGESTVTQCNWQVDGSGSAPTAITLDDSSYPATYAAGKWSEISATTRPGCYQLCLPAALVAAARVRPVSLRIEATGCIGVRETIRVDSVWTVQRLLGVKALWYVSKDGNDSNPGTIDSPKLTLASMSASASLQAGDAVLIGPGTWSEDGALASGVRWIGMGEGTVIGPASDGGIITLSDGATLENCKVLARAANGVVVSCHDRAELRDVWFSNGWSTGDKTLTYVSTAEAGAAVRLTRCRMDGVGASWLIDTATNGGAAICTDCYLPAGSVNGIKGSGVVWGGRLTSPVTATWIVHETKIPAFKPVVDLNGHIEAVSDTGAALAVQLTANAILTNMASKTDVASITQAQRVRISLPAMMERPDSGSTSYRIYIYAYDAQHVAEDLDGNPTVTAENNEATDRSANLSAVTKPAGTGIYYVDYTVASDHSIEGLVVKVNATEGGVTTQYAAAAIIVDTTAVDFTAADRVKLDAMYAVIPDNKPTVDGSGNTRAVAEDGTGLLKASGYTAPDNAGIGTASTAAAAAQTAAESAASSAGTAATAAAAAKIVTDKVDTTLVADGLVYRFTANSLELAPTGGASGGFTGPLGVTLNFRDADGAAVGGAVFTIVGAGSGAADPAGQFVVGLEAGEHTIHVLPKDGVIWAARTFTVTADGESFNIDGASASLPAPPTADTATGTLTVYDAQGAAAADVVILFRLKSSTGTAGRSFPRRSWQASSGAGGVLTDTFVRGLSYEGCRDGGAWVSFSVPDAESFTLPEILGQVGT